MNELTFHFWITNLTGNMIYIADLGVTIPPRKSINLYDKKHYHLSADQLRDSVLSGSLSKLCNMAEPIKGKIAIRRVPPKEEAEKQIEFNPELTFQSRGRSSVKVDKITFDEFETFDDQVADKDALQRAKEEAFATEVSEMTDEDYGRKK